VRTRDLRLQPLDLFGWCVVVVLIVERQVADLRMPEGELRRRELDNSVGELAVEGITAEAADDHGNLILGHNDLLCKKFVFLDGSRTWPSVERAVLSLIFWGTGTFPGGRRRGTKRGVSGWSQLQDLVGEKGEA
jgi:hypothetical protein